MREFYDKDTDLHWYMTENKSDVEKFKNINKTINNWDSPAIHQFIGDFSIADFMTVDFPMYMVGNKPDTEHCYAYYAISDDGKPLGITDVSVVSSNPNAATIDYLIVNPSLTNRGIGTRMIKSITHNIEWFAQNTNIEKIEAVIDERNKPSIRAVLKNNYVVSKVPSMSLRGFGYNRSKFYYTTPRVNINNNEQSEKEN